MNDTGLLLIQEHRAWSSLANQIYDCLNQTEKDRLFDLLLDQSNDEIIAEQQRKYSHSLVTEEPIIKLKEKKKS
jgi:hypothetical protein